MERDMRNLNLSDTVPPLLQNIGKIFPNVWDDENHPHEDEGANYRPIEIMPKGIFKKIVLQPDRNIETDAGRRSEEQDQPQGASSA